VRFDRIRGRNIGPFKGDFDLEIAALPGLLISVEGENGAGKTTLLGLLPGTLFREVPTRGSLAALATGRDSFCEVTVVNGARHVVRQLIDSHTGKGETAILDDAGAAVLGSGKVKEADRWIAEHFPPAELLYSSSFAVQGSRGLFDLTAAERKAVINRALGIEHYERLAEAARERARGIKAILDGLRAWLADLGAPNLPALEAALVAARQRVEEAAEALRGARVALDRAKAAAGDAARQAELAEQRRAAQRRLAAAQKALGELDERLKNNQGVLDQAEQIRTAIAQAADLDGQIEDYRGPAADAVRAYTAAVAAEHAAGNAHQRALDDVGQAQGRALRAQNRLKDRDTVEIAAHDVLRGREREAEFEAALPTAEETAVELEQLVLSGKDQRIEGLRSGLERIADHPDDFKTEIAREAIDTDDQLAARAEQAPSLLAAARVRLTELRHRLAEARKYIAERQAVAARAGEIAQAEADYAQAKQEEAAASERLQAAKEARDEARVQRAETNRAAEAAEAALETLRGKRARLNSLLALRERLEKAEARIEELQAQEPVARAAVAQAEAELATLPQVDPAKPVDLASHEREVERQGGLERAAGGELARAEAKIDRAKEVLHVRAGIEKQISEAEDELADWTRLAADLGKDGLQAMEIDAALPELGAITNDLLHACHGPRFTVEFRTDRLSADAKRTIEDFEIRVIDTERGRDALAETYSGGELVLVGSAVSLALTTLACRRYGHEHVTIVRDESGAALSPANARAWVAMLRRAATAINADKVLMVTHSPELAELADAHIRLADGRIEVMP